MKRFTLNIFLSLVYVCLQLLSFLLHFVHFFSVTSCNDSHIHWKFWPSVVLAQFAGWINTQSEETAYIVPGVLSLLMMKVKLKIPPNHVFFLLLEQPNENNSWRQLFSMKVFGTKTVPFFFPSGGHKFRWVGDVIHLQWDSWKPLSCQVH